MTETVQPARPQPNPYLSQTADDKNWQLMSAAPSQALEPFRAWLPRNSLVGSAEDRASARGHEGEVRKKDDLLASLKATALLTSALLLPAARAAQLLTSCAVAVECLSLDLLRDGS
ncbi:hypothetical protein ABBQ32_009370 [Trebouxia sp. C0010 RCD-2024]